MEKSVLNRNFNGAIYIVISGFVGILIGYLVQVFLGLENSDINKHALYFKFLDGIESLQVFVYSLSSVVIFNVLIAVIFGLISFKRIALDKKLTRKEHLLNCSKYGLNWGIINFILWGTFSIIIYSFGNQTTKINLNVFYTSALISGFIHSPLATIGFYFISEIWLDGTDEKDLYDLNYKAILRFYIPNFLVGISTGILFAYFCHTISSDSFAYQIYLNRAQVLIVLIIWFVFLYFVFHLTDTVDYTRKILKWNSIALVWSFFFVIWFVFVLLGIEFFLLFESSSIFTKQLITKVS